jgi:hypothetical protein
MNNAVVRIVDDAAGVTVAIGIDVVVGVVVVLAVGSGLVVFT